MTAIVSSAKEAVSNAHETANEKVDAATSTLGNKLGSAAERVRSNEIVAQTANRLDAAGNYLESANYDSLVKDVGEAIKRHPVPVLLAGVGIGYLLGKYVAR